MTDQTNVPTPAPKSGRWIKLALFSSLAVNVAVAGIVIGAAVRYGPDSDRRPPRMDDLSGPYTRALTSDDRRAIGRRIRQEQRDLMPNRAALQTEFAAMLSALRATPFAPDDVGAILARQRNIGEKRSELGHQLLLEHLTAMSDVQRVGFARRLEDGLKRHNGPARQGKPERN